MVIHAASVEAVARCTRYGVVHREACVVVESEAELGLCLVDVCGRHNGAYGLTSALTHEAIVVVGCAIGCCPVGYDVALGIGRLATPVHEVVLRCGHATICYHLLDLCYIHGVGCLATLQCICEGLDVEGAVALLDVLLNHVTSEGHVGIEWQLGICAVAVDTTTLVQNLRYASLGCELLSRGAYGYSIDDERYHDDSEQRYEKKLTLF